ncbi:hypothetical protein ACQKWADRAFT_130206 [Trichoderma austrokoningii]
MTEESWLERSKKKWKKFQQRGRSPRESPLSATNPVSALPASSRPPTSLNAPISPSSTIGASGSITTVSTPEIAAERQDAPINLWSRAFERSSKEAKKWIREHNLDLSDQSKPEDHIKEITRLIESKSLRTDQDGNSKIDIGYQKIVVREYIAGVAAFLTMAGDIAVHFAPPQASAPWAIAKAVLKIPVKQNDQMAALAGTVQWFTRIVRRGQLYELLYNTKTTDGDAVLNMHEALLDLYVAAIELLARSDTLIQSGVAKQTLNAILRPEQATGFVADLAQKEQRLLQEIPVCEASRSAIAGKQADERSRDLLSSLDQLSSPLRRIDEGVAEIREMIDEEQLRGLLQFISPEGHGKSHVDIADSRIDDTGNWLIEHEGFRTWQAIPSSSTILWLKGTVGTGKTYLTWRAIEYVKTTLEGRCCNEGFAFFYCSRSATALQDPLIVLRSFVRQLFDRRSEHCYNRLIRKRKIAEDEGRSLGLKDCKELMLDFINSYSSSTIILDALDEASTTSTNHNLAEILIDILDKVKKPVKLFISSRPDREYLQVFEATATITVESYNQQADIEKYLEDRLYSTLSFKQRQRETQALIRNVFSSQNSAMFRWIHLQVQRLHNYTSHDAVKSWATTLPSTLTEAYDQLFDDMRKHDENDVALAERAIKWVLCSILPLNSTILLKAIRYSLQDLVLVEKEEQTEQQILSLCRDLLTIQPKSKTWALPHASVAEYFELKGITLAACDLFASKIVLGCLESFEAQTIARAGSMWQIQSFEDYVVQLWFLHVGRYDKWLDSSKGANADPELVTILKRFIGLPAESSNHYRRWINNSGSVIGKGHMYAISSTKAELLPENMALYIACRYGFYHTLRDWWDGNGKISKTMALEECRNGNTSLVQTVRGGCLPIFEYLIRLVGTDYSVSERRNAMEAALTFFKHTDIAAALMAEAAIDVNVVHDGYDDTLVQQTARYNPEMLQWLIDQGWADVNRESAAKFGSPLIAAASVLNVKSVEILLSAGANPNAVLQSGTRYDTALYAVGSNRMPNNEVVETVRLLLDSGADANQPLKTCQYGSAFETMICVNFNNHRLLEELLEMLLRAGADPIMVFDRGLHGSALAAAAFHGLNEVLETMIGGAVTREQAIRCLQSSRHPKEHNFNFDQDFTGWMKRRTETAKYLTDEVGVDEETLLKIGLWDVRPEKGDEYFVFKFE